MIMHATTKNVEELAILVIIMITTLAEFCTQITAIQTTTIHINGNGLTQMQRLTDITLT